MLLHDNGRHGGGVEADKKFAKVSGKLVCVADGLLHAVCLVCRCKPSSGNRHATSCA